MTLRLTSRLAGTAVSPPLNDGQQRKDQVSPKAGLVWTPHRNTAVRASYTRSLGGVSFDQSIRLEPTQVGGFNNTSQFWEVKDRRGTLLFFARSRTACLQWEQQSLT